MKDWKFITGQKDEDELYNLRDDPGEKNNLLSDHPKLVEVMKEIIRNHFNSKRLLKRKNMVK